MAANYQPIYQIIDDDDCSPDIYFTFSISLQKKYPICNGFQLQNKSKQGLNSFNAASYCFSSESNVHWTTMHLALKILGWISEYLVTY